VVQMPDKFAEKWWLQARNGVCGERPVAKALGESAALVEAK
jgi:hypothetical protein